MRAVWLLALNFAFEQRWTVVVMLVYGVFLGSIALYKPQPQDVVSLARMMAMYGVLFGGVLAAAAVQQDRRTRRILSVLSKGITRGQYLAGVLLGIFLALCVYWLVVAVAMTWAAARVGLNPASVSTYVVFTLSACLLALVTPLFFATLFPPMLALGFAGAVLALAAVAPEPLRTLLSVETLARTLGEYAFTGQRLPWSAAVMAIADTVVLWAAATLIFSRRDLAVAVD